MTKDLTTLRGRLKFARMKKRLSQDDLSGIARILRARISAWERNKGKPRAASVRRVADAMKIRVEWLICGDAPMEVA
jgi:transcriptional regulator with XRE-family HTH domain